MQFGHWDSLRKGLLAGERLGMELRRMEVAYMDHNKRDFEITKHISLRQLDPLALMGLRRDGACEFELPKALFDLDFPGHIRRRIKSVSVSVPCVVGPYTSVSGTLTILSHVDETGAASDIPVPWIATSTGQSDSGLFELNFRDERYLPFEGAGAVSRWRFGLPNEFRAFDYDAISDLVLHVRYTARDKPDGRDAAIAAVRDGLDNLRAAQGSTGLKLLISIKHDFPADWRALQGAADDTATRSITIGPALFPFFVRQNFTIVDVRALLSDGNLAEAALSQTTDPATGPAVSVNVTRAHQYLAVSYRLS